jgi:hypothetical protein
MTKSTKEALAKYRSNFKTLDGITPNPDYVKGGNDYRWNWDETWDGELWAMIYSLESQGIEFQLPGAQWSMVRKGVLRFKTPKDWLEWRRLYELFDIYKEIEYYTIKRKFAVLKINVGELQRQAKKRRK